MAELPFDLRTLVALKTWEDPKFTDDLRADAKKAVERLAKEFNLNVENIDFKIADERTGEYVLVIPANPMGAGPAEMRADRNQLAMLRGGGTVNTYTADCGCGSSYTGGCSCGSVFGTPCAACATVLLC